MTIEFIEKLSDAAKAVTAVCELQSAVDESVINIRTNQIELGYSEEDANYNATKSVKEALMRKQGTSEKIATLNKELKENPWLRVLSSRDTSYRSALSFLFGDTIVPASPSVIAELLQSMHDHWTKLLQEQDLEQLTDTQEFNLFIEMVMSPSCFFNDDAHQYFYWDMLYDVVFGTINVYVRDNLGTISYYDPDTSTQEDVQAYLNAVLEHNKIDSLMAF